MKVTTQRTSKSAKLFKALGVVGLVAGIYGLMAEQPGLAATALPLGGICWVVGKIIGWWSNE